MARRRNLIVRIYKRFWGRNGNKHKVPLWSYGMSSESGRTDHYITPERQGDIAEMRAFSVARTASDAARLYRKHGTFDQRKIIKVEQRHRTRKSPWKRFKLWWKRYV